MKKILSMYERAERRGEREDGPFARIASMPRWLLRCRALRPHSHQRARSKQRTAA